MADIIKQISVNGTTYDINGVFSTSSNGLVPAPTSANASLFLSANGTWEAAGGGGGSSTEVEFTLLANGWSNANIIVACSDETIECSTPATFYAVVGDEGRYTITKSGSSYYIDGGSTAYTYSQLGLSGASSLSTFYLVLTYDSYYTQTVTANGVESDSNGTVGVSQYASKTQYDSAAYGQLRLIDQQTDQVTIASYGVTPTVDIPCVITII